MAMAKKTKAHESRHLEKPPAHLFPRAPLVPPPKKFKSDLGPPPQTATPAERARASISLQHSVGNARAAQVLHSDPLSPQAAPLAAQPAPHKFPAEPTKSTTHAATHPAMVHQQARETSAPQPAHAPKDTATAQMGAPLAPAAPHPIPHAIHHTTPHTAHHATSSAAPHSAAATAHAGKPHPGHPHAKSADHSAAAHKEAPTHGDKHAASPSAHAAIAPAVHALHPRAAVSRKHPSPGAPVASAQSSAKIPETEKMRGAAAQTVENLHAADAEKIRRDEFKTKLKEAIEKATPKPTTESQADKVMKTGATEASGALRGQLATERDAAAGPLKSASTTEASASDKHAAPKTYLHPETVGAPPAPVSAAPIVPAPLPPEQLDSSSHRAPTDRAMAEGGISKEQLKKGNEPEFNKTVADRENVEKKEAAAEPSYRKSEAVLQGRAHTAADAVITHGLSSLHGVRGLHIGKVVGQQLGTSTKNSMERQRITQKIASIKDQAHADVTGTLKLMETGATTIFEAGLARAEQAYKDTFEDAKGGLGTWLTTWGSDWEELIENSLGKARVEYLHQVDIAIDDVANFVDTSLTAAKSCVADARTEVKIFVKGLDQSVQQFGEEALHKVSADFDAMDSEIDQHRDALVDKLAQQYKASYERMSAMEEKLREENKSLWQRIYDATVGLIKKILAFKDMLLSILAKAADVIMDIISDPIGSLGNLVSGVMLGLKNFKDNIGAHLKKGLMDWIFGALGGAGLKLPENFDLEGIVSIVLQVLGLTYANFRARAVAIVGEPVVAALEQAAEVFKVILSEGIPGLWRFIKEKLNDLKSMVLDAIFDFIKERVIIAGITWVIGLLNPASAFFKACKAIYDIVMFFINRGSQILALVNAIIDSMAAIAKGSIGVAAKWIEDALAKAIPVAIGFLASLLGLGDISGTIKQTIEKAQAPVNKAIDWVINLAVKAVKAVGKFVGGALGKRDTAHEDDPEKAAKIQAGLIALHAAEASAAHEGELSPKEISSTVKKVKSQHPVFKSLEAVPKADGWEYEYSASESRREPSPLRRHFEDEEVYQIIRDVANLRFGKASKIVEKQSKAGDESLVIKPGQQPLVLAPKILTREDIPEKGKTVRIDVGDAPVFAKQGIGPGNLIVAGLGKYREIAAEFERQGWDGPKVHALVMHELKTGEGPLPIKRFTALVFGVEPARLTVAGVTGPFSLISMGKGESPDKMLGREPDGKELPIGGGKDPVSMEKAGKAGRRADETIIEGKSFSEGTKIQERTEEFVQRVVDLTYNVLKGQPIKSPDTLRLRIVDLLEQFDKAAGVRR